MNRPPSSLKVQSEFETIALSLRAKNPSVELSKMFGMPCIKKAGKAFAGLWGNDGVFKLSGAAHARALKLPRAQLFDPTGLNRPMKQWVQVPHAHAKKWGDLAAAAINEAGK